MTSPEPSRRLGFAVCTRNRPELLKRCVESLLATTRQIADAVYRVVDDASDDETAAYLADLAGREPRLQWVTSDWQGGITVSFNRAAELLVEAGCDLVFVINDDVHFRREGWAPRYLEAARQSGIQHFNFMDGRNLVGRRELDGITISYHSWVRGCMEVFTREAFEALGGYDASLGDMGCMDTDLADRAIEEGWTDADLEGLARAFPIVDAYGLECMGFCADVDGIREYVADPHPNMGTVASDSGYPNKRIGYNLLADRRLERFEGSRDDPPELTVLVYHQFTDGATPHDPHTDVTHVEDLRDQMELLRLLEYEFVGLQDLADGDLPERSVLVTMDDGYRSQIDLAVPVLGDLGVRPALFLTANRIGSDRHDSHGQLRWLLDHVPFEALSSGYRAWAATCLGEIDVDLLQRVTRTPAGLRHHFRWAVPVRAHAALVESLQRTLGVAVDHEIAASIQPTWDEVLSIAPSVDFGAHGLEHHLLATLDTVDLEREIHQGAEALYDRIGPIDWFAYPYGFQGSFDQRAVMELYRSGYRGAFTAMPARNPLPLSGVYQLDRIPVGDQSAEGLFSALLLQR